MKKPRRYRDRILAPDGFDSDQFGNDVAISADGETLPIGSIQVEEVGDPLDAGALYIYEKLAGWTAAGTGNLITKLTASDSAVSHMLGFQAALSSDATDDDYFGRGVSLPSDGATMITGLYQD